MSFTLTLPFFTKHSRAISLMLAGLLLIGHLLFPLRALAVSAADIESLDSLEAAKSFLAVPGNGELTKYVTLPENPSSDTDADQVGIVLCKETAASCSINSPDGVRLMLDHVFMQDRQQGAKSYDFIFTPVIDGKRVNTPLKFIYRVNKGITSNQASTWGLIWDTTTYGLEMKKNVIANLRGFGDTALARKLLDKKASKEGVKWGNVTHSSDTGVTTSLAERATGDPFQQAVQKLAEIVSSLNETLVKAIKWPLNQGNLNDLTGLSKAWATVRDLVNILFIGVLIALALVTIVRLEPRTYSVRSILPLLVFAVITVNFSLLIASIMTNLAFILSQPLLEKATGLVDASDQMQQGFTSVDHTSFGQSVVLLLAAIIMLVALAILLIFFIIRVIVIWLLAALSPVVLLFMVLPLTRGESKKLITTWVKWVFMAPIAFLIMYIGAEMLKPVVTGDAGTSAMLNALFYGGVIAAAVFIPLGMGGRIMALATQHGGRAGKLGGKSGIGAIGLLPGGKGQSLAQRARTGRAFLKQRSDAREGQAAESAAGFSTALHGRLGSGAAAQMVTGLDAGQAQTFQDRLVDEQLDRLQKAGATEADMRQAINYKLGRENVKHKDLSPLQRSMADSRIGELAAVKGLSQGAWWDKGILDKYAHTGYQVNMAKWDPVMGNVKRKFGGGAIKKSDINTLDLGIQMAHTSGDDMRTIMGSTWRNALPDSELAQHSPEAYQVWRDALGADGRKLANKYTVNPVALRQIMDVNTRVAASGAKREAIGETYQAFGKEQQRAIKEGNLKPGTTGQSWVKLKGGPDLDQAQEEARKKFGKQLDDGEQQ